MCLKRARSEYLAQWLRGDYKREFVNATMTQHNRARHLWCKQNCSNNQYRNQMDQCIVINFG